MLSVSHQPKNSQAANPDPQLKGYSPELVYTWDRYMPSHGYKPTNYLMLYIISALPRP